MFRHMSRELRGVELSETQWDVVCRIPRPAYNTVSQSRSAEASCVWTLLPGWSLYYELFVLDEEG